MSTSPLIQLKYAATVFLFITHGISVASPATFCYDTPRSAIDGLSMGAYSSQAPTSRGYKVVVTQWDPVLGKRWAAVESCDHPEWPTIAVVLRETELRRESLRTAYSLAQNSPAPVVVHAGDVVRLWHQEDILRIETAGVSEESGVIGKTIRLRLLGRNSEDRSTLQQLLGVVRGPSNVEIQR